MYPSFDPKMNEIYTAGAYEKRRITRLMMESIEVAFHLCNTNAEEYPLTKIFDIINSIMPTAYILNTAYWIYYSGQDRQSLCVCLRFGLCCPHQLNDNHWINMDGITQRTEVASLYPLHLGKYWPTDLNVFVSPMINDSLRAYDVSIKMDIHSYYTQEVAAALQHPTDFILTTELRYLMTPEYRPRESKIVLYSPHPFSHNNYGRYFADLENYCDTFGSEYHFLFKNTIIQCNLPKLTVIPLKKYFPFDPNNYYNPNNSFNLSFLNEVNISIYNEHNYEKEFTDVSYSSFSQENGTVGYNPNLKSFDPFLLYNSKSFTDQSVEFPPHQNQNKHKKSRGKNKLAPIDTNNNLRTPNNDARSSSRMFSNAFRDNDFGLKKNQGVKRKERKTMKFENSAGGDTFAFPDVVIENSQDVNEFLEDISDIVKNEMKNEII
ncbi:hypothetical protein FQR65_LT07974 [Abscondita terminalis]|nr:hypothetical protein FQR65_LT07974 [Abscondita terminalis]